MKKRHYDVKTFKKRITLKEENERLAKIENIIAGEAKIGGTKHDSGKEPMALLSTVWLKGVSAVLGYGATKYSSDNWRSGIAYRRLISASLRHITSFMDGEDVDPETGLSHLDHASCCLMFLREMTVRHPNLDDRYKTEEKK